MRLSDQEYEALLARRKKPQPSPLARDLQTIMRPGFGEQPAAPTQARATYLKAGSAARGAMNKTEARFASEVLDVRKALGEIAEYWYESIKLRLADGSWFTIDFFVMLPDGRLEAIEVKGFWRDAARIRIKVAAEKYPFKFVAVQKVRQKDGGGWKFEAFG